MEEWTVINVKIKCPHCGRESIEPGEFVIGATWIECSCGFRGEIRL